MHGMFRRLTAFFAACMLAAVMAGSVGCTKERLQERIIDDKYDNFYEIFVYSFCDSDGDGVGDLNGAAQRLGYIRDMGYTAIYLTPVCPSPTYHKYDVTDYKEIDRQFGTLADFDGFVQKAHALGIKVVFDLVVNHTSSEHPWFREALSAARLHDTENRYYGYYHFSDQPQTGYAAQYGVYYEARFQSGMPDLNLDNALVREEIVSVMAFWLGHGVDGFRLDACTSYYTGDTARSAAFAGWLQEEAEALSPGCYLVGEAWTNRAAIGEFYAGGADSFFYFPAAESTGFLSRALRSSTPADDYFAAAEAMAETAGGAIAAPFLGNHDTGRIAGVVGRQEELVKFIYGAAGMLSGNLFTYYGDEIGMVGAATDPDKRLGMLWDEDEAPILPPGATNQEYVFESVARQQRDGDSILNYYRQCNLIRNAFPSVMRGSAERLPCALADVLLMQKRWQDECVTVAVNFSAETRTIPMERTLLASLTVKGGVRMRGGTLTLPGYAIAILSQ